MSLWLPCFTPVLPREGKGVVTSITKKEIMPGNGILEAAGVLDNAEPELSILGLLGFFVVLCPGAARLTKFRAPKERSFFAVTQFDRTGCAPGTGVTLFDK